MSIKNRKVNKLRASEESSDPNASREQRVSGDATKADLPSARKGLKEEAKEASASTKERTAAKVVQSAKTGGEPVDGNVANSKRNRFISIALVCLNIAIFIILFSGLLMLLKFVFAKIRQFFSEHVAAN